MTDRGYTPGMTTLILIMLAIVVLATAFLAAVLVGINRLFGLANNTYMHAVQVIVLAELGAGIVAAVGVYVASGLADLLWLTASFGAGYLLYNRFYKASFLKFLVAWLVYLIVLGAILSFAVFLVREHVMMPFVVEGSSMAPAYAENDYIFVERWDTVPEVDDVVIAEFPCEEGACYGIRRVTGLPGMAVNGTAVPEGQYYLSAESEPAPWTGLISAEAIIGMPILNLGDTGIE